MRIDFPNATATWIDLLTPTKDEAKLLLEEKRVPLNFIDELVSVSERPQVGLSDGAIYVVLHFPKSYKESGESFEVDFIIGKDYVITAHYEQIQALDHFKKIMEVESATNRGSAQNGFFIFSAILIRLYETMFDELEAVESAIKDVEDRIFSGQEKRMVFALSNLSRSMINFRKALDPHERILHQLFEAMDKLGMDGEETAHKASIMNSFEKVKMSLKSQNEILRELQETNSAMLSTKQNEIMKTLTIVVFLTMPMSLIAAILTIPTSNTPFIGHPDDFWLILGGMGAVVIALLIFVRLRKWI